MNCGIRPQWTERYVAGGRSLPFSCGRLFLACALLVAAFPAVAQDLLPPVRVDSQRPSTENVQLGGGSIYGAHRNVERQSGKFKLPELRTPTIDLSVVGNGSLPDVMTEDTFQQTKPLPEGFADREGDWTVSQYLWKAPNTFSHPLYFEDVMLERHGHERFPALTPLISGARFVATIPMLPYLATVQPPCEYNYTLGHFRSGSAAPKLLQRPPYQRDAMLRQAATVTGYILALP